MLKWNFLYSSLYTLLLVLSLGITEEMCLAPSFYFSLLGT